MSAGTAFPAAISSSAVWFGTSTYWGGASLVERGADLLLPSPALSGRLTFEDEDLRLWMASDARPIPEPRSFTRRPIVLLLWEE